MSLLLETSKPTEIFSPNDRALDCPKCGPNETPYLHLQNVVQNSESVVLTYSCEFCGEVSSLHLEQYKGQTLVTWQ